MTNKKRESFIYEGFGFPVRLVKAPFKKVGGEWIFDFNMDRLQKAILKKLAIKPSAITGKELRFIIRYFGMSDTDFGQIFGVTPATVVKWKKTKIPLNKEIYLRFYLRNHLKVTDKKFKNIPPENLALAKAEKTPLKIDLNTIS